MNRFFVSTFLNGEKFLEQEIHEVWPWLLSPAGGRNLTAVPEIKLEEGGVEFECDFFLGLQLNFFLKQANRVLWRWDEFKCKHISEFNDRLKKIPWNDRLGDAPIQFDISCSQTRLSNEKSIFESIEKYFAAQKRKVMKKSSEVSAEVAKILIRIHEDRCSISIDCSGEHLHRRGILEYRGEAPIRETLAAFLVRSALEGLSLPQMKTMQLVDPFCGSGTLLIEAECLYRPHWFRNFAFMNWKLGPKIYKSESWRKNFNLPTEGLFKSYLGIDINAKALQAAQKNWENLKKDYPEASAMEWILGDSASELSKKASHPHIIVTNPPYGDRVRLEGEGQVGGQRAPPPDFGFLFSSNPLRLAIILPTSFNLKPEGYKVLSQIPVKNGGISCRLTVYERL